MFTFMTISKCELLYKSRHFDSSLLWNIQACVKTMLQSSTQISRQTVETWKYLSVDNDPKNTQKLIFKRIKQWEKFDPFYTHLAMHYVRYLPFLQDFVENSFLEFSLIAHFKSLLKKDLSCFRIKSTSLRCTTLKAPRWARMGFHSIHHFTDLVVLSHLNICSK